MTPAARISAAIGLLDAIVAGAAAEQVLTSWARKNRYAGSKDRAAIRDHVFDALRCRRSYAALGGAESGRGLMIGAMRAAGVTPDTMFTGEGYAPQSLTDEETRAEPDWDSLDDAVRLDCPGWLAGEMRASLGEDFAPVMHLLRSRAPVFLRANTARITRDEAHLKLAGEGIQSKPHALAKTALEVTENARRIQNSAAFRDGLVELQDAASQAVVERIPVSPGARVLDFCAGGGGKALALAARDGGRVVAHDANPGRMRDLPVRAVRAGAAITCIDREAVTKAAPFDLVLVDAPCSGSGAWRRSPQGKWLLTPQKLDELCALQSRILDEITGLVSETGTIAYVTCSLLARENDAQVDQFLTRHPDWHCSAKHRFTPLDGGDGFFIALLTR